MWLGTRITVDEYFNRAGCFEEEGAVFGVMVSLRVHDFM
jgi:hypothetical protein